MHERRILSYLPSQGVHFHPSIIITGAFDRTAGILMQLD